MLNGSAPFKFFVDPMIRGGPVSTEDFLKSVVLRVIFHLSTPLVSGVSTNDRLPFNKFSELLLSPPFVLVTLVRGRLEVEDRKLL